MYGAILGDIVGCPYEFTVSPKVKNFPLFIRESKFTDDTVMTIAIADALINNDVCSENTIKNAVIDCMHKWGHKYPNESYGGRFSDWLFNKKRVPYWSFGNGSAMRVSSVGWLYDTIKRTREVAKFTSAVTHDHPEGIKGAESVASVIFLARNKTSKEDIKKYVKSNFGYDLSRTCDEIRHNYRFDETCQGTVPEAITAFLEGQDFEDVIRTAVTLGGDCDTLTCIAGSMAEAFYGVPENLKEECRKRLTPEILKVIDKFDEIREKNKI